jgi:hypothetical protein
MRPCVWHSRSLAQVNKTTIMTRILQLVHEICTKGIHVTKRDLFYTGAQRGCSLATRDRGITCPAHVCTPAVFLIHNTFPFTDAKLFEVT